MDGSPIFQHLGSAKKHPYLPMHQPPGPRGAALQPCPVPHLRAVDGLYPRYQLRIHWEGGVLQKGHFTSSKLELIYCVSPRNLI